VLSAQPPAWHQELPPKLLLLPLQLLLLLPLQLLLLRQLLLHPSPVLPLLLPPQGLFLQYLQ